MLPSSANIDFERLKRPSINPRRDGHLNAFVTVAEDLKGGRQLLNVQVRSVLEFQCAFEDKCKPTFDYSIKAWQLATPSTQRVNIPLLEGVRSFRPIRLHEFGVRDRLEIRAQGAGRRRVKYGLGDGREASMEMLGRLHDN